MYSQIELLCLGVGTVIDTVLLLIVFERVNRSQIADWLYALLVGVWLVHASSFVHELLIEVPGMHWASRVCLTLSAVGLVILPCAMIHAALWLNYGKQEHKKRYALLYLPLLSLFFVAHRIWNVSSSDFITVVQPLAKGYMASVIVVNSISCALFIRLRNRLRISGAEVFFPRFAALLAFMTAIIVAYYVCINEPILEKPLRLLLILAPVLPSLLFVWHALSQRMLPIVMERTLVYGACLVMLLFLHRLLVAPLATSLQAKAKVDLLLVEGWVLVVIVLMWPPLRTRFREALRYLVSTNVLQIRDATRRLSVEMSQLTWQSSQEFIDWMTTAVRDGIGVDSVRIWIVEPADLASPATVLEPASTTDLDDRAQVSEDSQSLACSLRDVQDVFDHLQSHSDAVVSRGHRTPDAIEEAMSRLKTMWAFRLHFRSIKGVVLLGPRIRSDRLADEQLHALALLFDQFAATLHNRHLDMLRTKVERQMMQQEKLSTLGLIAGSLAHELRNPLSSMRTIASLMLEDLGTQNEHSRDVTIILDEIDRLSQTTGRLLDFSRPGNDRVTTVQPDRVIDRLLHILTHLARQSHVALATQLNLGDTEVATTDSSLSEVLFNLIKNGIEAAAGQPKGCVQIETQLQGTLCLIRVADNGPGISEEFQRTMFEPFVTGKAQGTGLGLYIVNERVQEMQGTIACNSSPENGTEFRLLLPILKKRLFADFSGWS